jgi:hypothetical protein
MKKGAQKEDVNESKSCAPLVVRPDHVMKVSFGDDNEHDVLFSSFDVIAFHCNASSFTTLLVEKALSATKYP